MHGWFLSISKQGFVTAQEVATIPVLSQSVGPEAASKFIKAFDKKFTKTLGIWM
jgi:hypothetical protein